MQGSPVTSCRAASSRGRRLDEDSAAHVRAIDLHYRQWVELHRGVPGVTVHSRPSAAWMIQPGLVWSNMVADLHMDEQSVRPELEAIRRTYEQDGRGVGFWVSGLATPASLPRHLKSLGLRCRKHYPGMVLDLRDFSAPRSASDGLRLLGAADYGLFSVQPHPYWGRINSKIRRFELERLRWLTRNRSDRFMDFVLFEGSVPVGSCSLQIGEHVGGIHDVGVAPEHRRRGVGMRLLQAVCGRARDRGMTAAVLISSGMGYGLYRRVGFEDAGPISFWYANLRACG